MRRERYEASQRPSLSDSNKIQEIFLNHCRKNKIELEILSTQESCQGYVAGFDHEAIVIESADRQILYYKAFIISLKPLDEVKFIFHDTWHPKRQQAAYRHRRSDYLQ